MAIYIEHLEGKVASISVAKCVCGYHMGFDDSYLEQVGNISTLCPACGLEISTAEIDELNYNLD